MDDGKAMAKSRLRLPELARDSHLETQLMPEHTVHFFTETPTITRQEVWKRTRRIGVGGFGTVWLEKCVRGHQPGNDVARAVKVIHLSGGPSAVVAYGRELEALAKFSQRKYSSCFVKSYGWFESESSIFICMEYLPLGDLRAYLARQSQPWVPEAEVKQIISQVLEALKFMHVEGFAHGDLKPANILIKSHAPDGWWVKLSDLGLSRRIEATRGSVGVQGTPGFIAPELYGFQQSETKTSEDGQGMRREFWYSADVWATGETAFQLVTGKATFQNVAMLARYARSECEFPASVLEQSPCHPSSDLVGFVMLLMLADPSQRPTVSTACDQPWIVELKRARSVGTEHVISFPSSSISNVGGGTHADTYASDPNPSATGYRDWTTVSSPPGLPTQALADGHPTSTKLDTESSSIAVPPSQSLYPDSNSISLRKRNSRVSVPENSRRLELEITPSSSWSRSTLPSPARSLIRPWSGDEVENIESARSFGSIPARTALVPPVSRSPVLPPVSRSSVLLPASRSPIMPPVFDVPPLVNRLLRLPRGNFESRNRPIISTRNALIADEIEELMGDFRKTTSTAFPYTTLKGTDKKAVDVRFSPDSKSIITYGAERVTVGVWDVEGGSLIDVAEGGCLTFSPDAHRLAVVGWELLRIWTSGDNLLRVDGDGNTNEISSRDIKFRAAGKTQLLALSWDGERVASASSDGTISVFDTTKGKMVKKLRGPKSPVLWVCYSPIYNTDQRLLAALFRDGQLRIWEEIPRKIFGNWIQRRPFNESRWPSKNNILVDGAIAAADTMHTANAHLAVAANDGRIYIWRHEIHIHYHDVAGTLRLFDEMVVAGHKGKVSALAFTPDSTLLASASPEAVSLWRVPGGLPITTIRRPGGSLHSLAFSPDAQSLVSLAADDGVRVWNATRIRDLTDIQSHVDEAVFLAASPDGRYVASVTRVTGPRKATIMVWDVENITLLTLIKQPTTNILALSFSVDSLRLGSISLDHVVHIWDIKTGECLKTAVTPQEVSDVEKMPCGAFSPHLRQCAIVISFNKVERSGYSKIARFAVLLGDVIAQPNEEAGEVIFWRKTLKGRVAEDDILAITFSPNGKKISAVNQEDTVTIWDTETGQILAHLVDFNQAPPKGRFAFNFWRRDVLDAFRAHFREVGSPFLRFSEDSEKLAFFSGLTALRTWNVENGRFLGMIGDVKATNQASSDGSDGSDGSDSSDGSDGSDDSVFDVLDGRSVPASISPDWTRAVVRDGRKRLGLWDVGDGRLVRSLEQGEQEGGDMIRHAIFSPNSRWLVTASDKDLVIWDAATGAESKAVAVGVSWPLRSVTFWPDSRHVVTVSRRRVLQFWDVESGAMVKAVEGHTGRHGVVW